MSLILQSFYFISLLAAAFATCWLAFKQNQHSRKIDQASEISTNINRSYTFFAFYYLLNLLTESTIWITRPFHITNHFIYAIGFMLAGSFILLFFLLQSSSKILPWLILVVFGFLLSLFIIQRLWHPNSLLTFSFLVSYYACIAIVSAIFLSQSLLDHFRFTNQFNVNIGILFFIYHFVSMFITVFGANGYTPEIDEIVFYINQILCILFYFSSSLLIYKMIKTNFHAR